MAGQNQTEMAGRMHKSRSIHIRQKRKRETERDRERGSKTEREIEKDRDRAGERGREGREVENEGRERSFEEKCRELLWDNILCETAAAEESLFWCRTGPWSM